MVDVVLRWVTSDAEARRWASLPARPRDASVFDRWHAEPGLRAYLFTLNGTLVGYGEIWEDADADEAELARLIVEPERRGQGLGRWLVRELLAEARRLGWSDVWLRVAPDNEPALRCYAAAGFRRATQDEETSFNVGQPIDFIWMAGPG
jgi:ribosomal protein S18 acetylase RimI-like enzyme